MKMALLKKVIQLGLFLSCFVLLFSRVEGAPFDASEANSAQAQGPILAYTFKPILIPGEIPRNARDVRVLNPSLNDRGEVAFEVEWSLPNDSTPHGAIYTQERKVVDTWGMIDGKKLCGGINSLRINNRGHVMYLASFTLPPEPGTENRVRYGNIKSGYFVEQHLVWELDRLNPKPTRTSKVYFSDDDLLYGLMPSKRATPAKYAPFVTFTTDGDTISQGDLPNDIKTKLRRYIRDFDKGGVGQSVSYDGTVLAVLPNPDNFSALPWTDPNDIGGPSSGQVSGQVDWKQLPHASNVAMPGVRTILINSSGAPILMYVGDQGMPQEILSPLGMVSYLRVDKNGYYYETGGYRVILNGASVINGSGQILFHVEKMVDDGLLYEYMLATPNKKFGDLTK